MPMDFPDMRSLILAAEAHKFRAPRMAPELLETEEEYRAALADHVAPIDFIESQEIRHKVGWDQWSDQQNIDMLARAVARSK